MNWTHIDLNSPAERDTFLIDPLSFADLLLEVECNLADITAFNLTAQFERDLTTRLEEARWLFLQNLENLLNHARAQRVSP